MPFTIQTVPTLKAAEERLAAFVNSVQTEPAQRVNVLTGSITQCTYFRRTLGTRLGPIANVHFFTPESQSRGPITGLVQEILRCAAKPSRLPLPDGGDVLLVAELLRRLHRNAQIEQLDPDLQGVPEAVRNALNDLREGGISAVEFRRALRRSDAGKLHDLANLYKSHESFEGTSPFIDRPALYRDALDDRVPDEAVRSALGDAPTAVIGLYDATPMQVALIRRCAQLVDLRVLLVVTAEPEFTFAQNFKDALIEAGATAQDSTDHSTDEPETQATVAHFSAPSRQAEAEEVARQMLKLARDHGVPFNKMAVLHRLDDSYDDLVTAVLDRAGIPVCRGTGRSVRHTAAGQAVLVLLDLLLEPPTRHRLLEFLGNPALRPDVPTLGPAVPPRVRPQPVRWERISKSAGMVTGWDRFHTQLDAYVKMLGDREDQEQRGGALQAAAELGGVVARLAAAAAAGKALQSWSDYGDWLLDVLGAYLAPEEEEGPLSTIRSQIEALRQLDWAEIPVDGPRFHHAAAHAVRRAVESGGFLKRDGAFLGNVNAARWLRFQAVFLTECAERIFPSLIQPDPILLDDERETLNRRLGRKALPIKRERAQEEELLFTLVQQSATHFLTISWARRTTTSGAPRLSSPFLRKSIQSNREEWTTERELVDQGLIRRLPARLAGAAPPPEQLATNDWSAVDAALDETDFRLALLEAAPAEAPTVLRMLWSDYARYQAARLGRNASHFNEYDGCIPPDALRRDPPFSVSTSATGLEEYATCPYRYFLRRILHVDAVAEPGEALEMTPLDRGQLVHTILERWIKQWIEVARQEQVDWPAYLHDDAYLMQVAQEEFAAADLSGLAGLPATWDVVREEVLSDLRRVLELERARAEEGYRPIGVEIGFGDLAVPLPDGTELRFRGRIDRVDRGPAGIVAIDYKTGAFRKRAEDYCDGSALQLPIYLLAAAREFGDEPGAARAEYWYATRKGNFARSGLGGATVLADAAWADALASISAGVRAGRFFPYPGKAAGGRRRPNCTFCDFASVCATDVDQRFEAKAKQDQDTVRAFRTLQAQRHD